MNDQFGADVPQDERDSIDMHNRIIAGTSEAVSQIETLRDKFAMAALPALIGKVDANDLALMAYRYADAMLEARKK